MTSGEYTKEQMLALQSFPKNDIEMHDAVSDIAVVYTKAVRSGDLEDAAVWFELLRAAVLGAKFDALPTPPTSQERKS
jgi:hypothetical protein